MPDQDAKKMPSVKSAPDPTFDDVKAAGRMVRDIFKLPSAGVEKLSEAAKKIGGGQ